MITQKVGWGSYWFAIPLEEGFACLFYLRHGKKDAGLSIVNASSIEEAHRWAEEEACDDTSRKPCGNPWLAVRAYKALLVRALEQAKEDGVTKIVALGTDETRNKVYARLEQFGFKWQADQAMPGGFAYVLTLS
jgi:hypothetical protein